MKAKIIEYKYFSKMIIEFENGILAKHIRYAVLLGAFKIPNKSFIGIRNGYIDNPLTWLYL